MWQAIVLSFLAGLVGGNGVPHFLRGITKRPYPSALGNSPVPNLVAGWVALVAAGFLLLQADVADYPVASLLSGALGVLAIGLFHAGPGAFGRTPRQAPAKP